MNVHLQSHHEVHSCFHSYDDDLHSFTLEFLLHGVESCKNKAGVSQINHFFTVRLYDNYLMQHLAYSIMIEDTFMVRDGEVMGYMTYDISLDIF